MEERYENDLFELGEAVRELLLLAESKRDDPPTLKRAESLKNTVIDILRRLKETGYYISIMSRKIYPNAQRVRDRSIFSFSFGDELFVQIVAEVIIQAESGHPEAVAGRVLIQTGNEEGDDNDEDDLDDEEEGENDGEPTPAILEAICQEGTHELFAKTGFAMLNTPNEAPGEDNAHASPDGHVLLTALELHWSELRREAQRKEYLVGSYDDWADKLTEPQTLRLGNTEKFVIGFIAEKDMNRIGDLPDNDAIPNCECTFGTHRKILTAWKTKTENRK